MRARSIAAFALFWFGAALALAAFVLGQDDIAAFMLGFALGALVLALIADFMRRRRGL